MSPEEFRKLYIGEFTPHPFEKYTKEQLLLIEKDKFALPEDRRLARKIRIQREEVDEVDEIMMYGNCMYRIDRHGKRHHVPREQWDVTFKPSDQTAHPHTKDEPAS